MNKLFLAALVTGALTLPAYAADYTIMAPAAPGGGWDSTARTMQEAMQADGVSSNVQVTNVA
ncbi:MAG TPA: tripartite tricarboxylate transporter substrate binding protein, partial [Devosia sp.]|nr:tripartite tricarboxylate transporter substrate binding protein [Devosia sp.]